MQPSDREEAKERRDDRDRETASVVVPFKPRPAPRRPLREPNDPGPDSAA